MLCLKQLDYDMWNVAFSKDVPVVSNSIWCSLFLYNPYLIYSPTYIIYFSDYAAPACHFLINNTNQGLSDHITCFLGNCSTCDSPYCVCSGQLVDIVTHVWLTYLQLVHLSITHLKLGKRYQIFTVQASDWVPEGSGLSRGEVWLQVHGQLITHIWVHGI